jgi:hypothetical protein
MNQTALKCSKRLLIALLGGAFLLSSEPSLWASPQQSSQSSTEAQTKNDPLPEAPNPQAAQTQDQQSAQAPSGAAGAKAPEVKGAPVAQPSGAAVAPVRPRGHRSLIIKLGLVAGAAVAVGAAVALSAKSPSRPPGASASAQ